MRGYGSYSGKQSEDGVPRVAYVLKVFPRLSQSFILNEILEHERVAMPFEIFSLKRPKREPIHSAVSSVATDVTYLPDPEAESAHAAPAAAGDEYATASELTWAAAVARESKARGVDHLHAHFATGAANVARLAARAAGITFSFTAHARDIFHEGIDQRLLGIKIAAASAVVTVSEFNVRHLEAQFGEDANAIERIYNGVDLTVFPFHEAPDRRSLVLAIGRLVEKKGFEVLVRAASLMRNELPEMRVEIVGSGPLEPTLRDLIASLRLEEVCSLVGALPREAVQERMRQAALLAVPCVIARDGDRDGLPTVLIEAMAVGTPCVSTDVVGIPEIVRHEETGLVTVPGDPADLAGGCLRVLNDVNLGRSLAIKARNLVERSFDTRRNAGTLRDLFRRAVTGGAR